MGLKCYSLQFLNPMIGGKFSTLLSDLLVIHILIMADLARGTQVEQKSRHKFQLAKHNY